MKRLITLTVSILLASFSAFSQVKQGEIYSYVEQMPEPGFSITEYMSANLSYPADAQATKIEGKVVLKFIVNEEGALDSIRVIRKLYPSIDSTAVSLTQKMPRWKPAMQSGKAVKAYYTLPVFFKIHEIAADTLDTEPEPLFDLITFTRTNLQYPKEAEPLDLSGTVLVEYIINEDSTISNIQVAKSIHPILDSEAVRIVRIMPKWKPGTINGKQVPSLNTLPVYFGWNPPTDVYSFVEEMPDPGFNIAQYLSQTVRYPESAKEANIQGRVVVKFVVNEDGSISDTHVESSPDDLLTKEALRVVNAMPRWKPGKQFGKPVKVFFTMPIMFRLG